MPLGDHRPQQDPPTEPARRRRLNRDWLSALELHLQQELAQRLNPAFTGRVKLSLSIVRGVIRSAQTSTTRVHPSP